MKKLFILIFFITFASLTSTSYSETLNFGSIKYEGDVKKGKAHGIGVLTLEDGSKYEGKFKRNKIHGKGKYTDSNGIIFEGKWRRGKFKNKIDKRTREIIKLSLDTGKLSYFEIKGKGKVSSKWFEAEKTSSGGYELTSKGQRDMNRAEAAAASGGSDGSGSSGGGSGGGSGC